MGSVFRVETWGNFVQRVKWKDGREREEEQGDVEEEEPDWMQKSSSGRRIDEMHFPE